MTGTSFVVGLTISWAAAMAAQPVFAEELTAVTQATENCLSCHQESEDKIRFEDGVTKSVRVDRKGWLNSVHGKRLACTDCHREISGYPHQKSKYKDLRDATLARTNTCQRCHYAHYTRMLDSTHYEMMQMGYREAPTCVDCHGSHNIHNPKKPRTAISNNCGNCHSKIFEQYKTSAHAKALFEENNEDVPVCTDCHGAHAIQSPTKSEFHAGSYKICAQCHGDRQRMEKYNLNTEVLNTYLYDFHGASNRLYTRGAGTPQKAVATCVDCHGVHDIRRFDMANEKTQIRERVVQSCRKCHKEVPANFADAWLSHYAPTLKTAPLVWLVKAFYKFAIPLILLGLVLHILLHLWRLSTHR